VAEAANIAALLSDLSRGDPDAWERLAPIVFDELRRPADSAMRRENAAHTLQPAALVNEAYLRLIGQRETARRTRLGGAQEAAAPDALPAPRPDDCEKPSRLRRNWFRTAPASAPGR